MDDNFLKHLINSINIAELKGTIGKRKICIWGAYYVGKEINMFLHKEGIPVEGYIDSHKVGNSYNDQPVFKPDNILNKEKYYVIVAVNTKRQEIDDYFTMYGYSEMMDYLYVSESIPEITLVSCKNNYSDSRGNEILFKDGSIDCKVTFIGYNSKLIIDKGFNNNSKIEIVLQNNAYVQIGKYITTQGRLEIQALMGGRIIIGDNCNFDSDTKIITRNDFIEIGNYNSFGSRFLGLGGNIRMDDDCMISHDVSILGTNSHNIYEISTKENVTKKWEKGVVIGKHVWLGKGATVIYNSNIGDNSIIGAGSVVKTNVDSECIAAGNPAKVIKRGYTWNRQHTNIAFDDI